MAFVVPLLSTPWTLASQQIVRGALELCQAVGGSEPVSAEDNEVCMRALNGILKELPLHGVSWPKITSAAVSLTWAIATPGQVSAPVDYFGVPVLKFTNANGALSALGHVSKPAFDALDTTQTARYPQRFFVAPDLTFKLWPTPTQDPVLKLTYQAVITDASLTQVPDIQAAYLNGLQYWLANEVALKFETPADIRREITQKYLEKRMLMTQWGVDMAPISFQVDNA